MSKPTAASVGQGVPTGSPPRPVFISRTAIVRRSYCDGRRSAAQTTVGKRRHMTWQAYPSWLNAGDNAWQMTAATFVGLMSLPGLAVLYGGVMQKRWSVNSMMLTFVAFCSCWSPGVCGRSRWASAARSPRLRCSGKGFFDTFWGKSGSVLSDRGRGGPGDHSVDHGRPAVPLPRGLARVLPVRVRGDHADPDARLGARADQLQGVDPVRAAVDHVRLHGQRVPDLGRRLLRRARRAGLLRWLCDPSRGRGLRASSRRR